MKKVASDDSRTTDPFGFDLPDDEWLVRLRSAESARDMGRLGEFEILGEIGRGGQGVVYKARQPRTGRIVALKCLTALAQTGAGARIRFEREIDAVCKLSHPGIVTVHGVELLDSRPVLAMEWVNGESIERWAARLPSPRLRPLLTAFVQACEAVEHAHRHGVIHRDLKPSNILVDAAGRVRVLDFGLAKLAGAEALQLTAASGFLGTPEYASPEQIAAGPGSVDTRTDVYSLGVVLYELLAGRSPFRADGLAEIFDRVRDGRVAPPSSVRRDVGRELDCIVLKAIATEPERRFQSVEALRDDVTRYLGGRPVRAHPPGAWYRFRAAARRRPITLALAVAAGTGIVTLAVISTSLAINLSGREKELSTALEAAKRSQTQAEKSAAASDAAATMLTELVSRIQEAVADRAIDATRPILRTMCDQLEQGRLVAEPEAELRLWDALAAIAAEGTYRTELERCIARGLPLATSLHGEGSAEAARWKLRLGFVFEDRRDLDEAKRLYLEAEAALAANDQRLTAAYATTAHNLGSIHKQRKEWADAEKWYLEALELRRRVHGEGSAEVARALVSLADLERRRGRLDEARARIEAAADIAELLDEPTERSRTLVDTGRSRIAVTAGDAPEAERILRGAVARLDARVAPDSPRLAGPLRELATLLIRQRRDEDAAATLDRLLVAYSGAPEDHIEIVRTLVEHAECNARLEQAERAAASAREALRMIEKLVPARPDYADRARRLLPEADSVPADSRK